MTQPTLSDRARHTAVYLAIITAALVLSIVVSTEGQSLLAVLLFGFAVGYPLLKPRRRSS